MIDEKKLIEELMKRVRTPRSTMEILRDIIPFVESQPKVGEWIPCSERLPKPYEKVLVFTDGHSQEVWALIEDMEDELLWEDDYGYGQLIRNAIAWMPLPTPYNPDMRGGENG